MMKNCNKVGRKQNFTDDELIGIIDLYYSMYPEKKIKFADLAKFAEDRGFEGIKYYNFARNQAANNRIEEISKVISTYSECDHIIFSRPNIEDLLRKYKYNQNKLCKVINEIFDDYEKQAVAFNRIVSNRSKKLKSFNEMKVELNSKDLILNSSQQEIKEYKARLRKMESEIAYLKKFISVNVNNEIAKKIIINEGNVSFDDKETLNSCTYGKLLNDEGIENVNNLIKDDNNIIFDILTAMNDKINE